MYVVTSGGFLCPPLAVGGTFALSEPARPERSLQGRSLFLLSTAFQKTKDRSAEVSQGLKMGVKNKLQLCRYPFVDSLTYLFAGLLG